MPTTNGSRYARANGRWSRPVCHRVIVLSDRDEWADAVRRSLQDARLSIERATWDLADAIRPPFTALIVDLLPPFDRRQAVLEPSGHAAWHRLTICVVPGALDATATAQALEGAAFEVIGVDHVSTPVPVDAIRASVQDLVEKKKWLVPRLMDALGCADPRLISYLQAAVQLPPRRTVNSWAEELGLAKPQRIPASLRELGLPGAKEVLSWVLVIVLVVKASEEPDKTYTDLAEELGFRLPEQLVRYAKRLTDRAPGTLIGAGLDGALELMASILRPSGVRL